VATPGYFGTLGVPLVAGRGFGPGDDLRAPGVLLVNETMASRYWPGESPLGKRLKLANPQGPWVEVVGVVRDLRHLGLDTEPRPEMVQPYAQATLPLHSLQVVVLVEPGRAAGISRALPAAVAEVDPDQPVAAVRPLAGLVGESMSRERFAVTLFSMFALVALGIGVVGVYGLAGYAVSRRVREIGMRMVLGARRGELLGRTVARGVVPVAAGVLLGVAGALPVTRLMSGLLHGIGAGDPPTYLQTALVLILAAATAAFFPARRAAAVDPADTLRER
jgi:hypothetical protein